MDSMIKLELGKPYFYAAFIDEDMTIPIIETYLYAGFDEDDGHLFEEVACSTPIGDINDPIRQLCFAEGKINGILDRPHLLEWLKQDHYSNSVGKSIEYKAI